MRRPNKAHTLGYSAWFPGGHLKQDSPIPEAKDHCSIVERRNIFFSVRCGPGVKELQKLLAGVFDYIF